MLRKYTSLAISLGNPSRLVGIFSVNLSNSAFVLFWVVKSVKINPGEIVLDKIPYWAYSTVNALVNECKAFLLALYANLPGLAKSIQLNQ